MNLSKMPFPKLTQSGVIAAALATAPLGQAELLTNPGFEDGNATPDAWGFNDGGSSGGATGVYLTLGDNADASEVRSGENSVAVLNGGPSNARWFTAGGAGVNTFNLEAGTTYQVSVWMLRENLDDNDFGRVSISGLDALDGSSVNIGGNTVGFEQVSFSFTPDQDYENRRILLSYNNDGDDLLPADTGRIIFDDASVTAVPEPGAMSLLSLGGLLLATRRRS